jgi:uncharacterized glyoxalase superfamily protein PhnB
MATTKKSAKSSAKTAARKPAARKPAAKATKLQAAAPSFTVADVEKSLAWYRDILGFKVANRWEDKGKLLGVEMTAGDVLFMLGQDDWKKGRKRVKGQGVRIYCETTENIDRLADRIKANGGALTQEPTDQPWGMRDLGVEDPDGFQITIGANKKR